MKCEVCGSELKRRGYRVIIDRSELIVCFNCSRRASTIIETIDLLKPRQQVATPPPRFIHPRRRRKIVRDIVEDYAEIVKEARKRLGLTRAALAVMLGEKESTIRRIEDGMLIPPLEMAKKIERILKVKLIEEYEEGEEYKEEYAPSSYDLTLGDIVEFKGGD